jgi:hypothetical protein
MELRDEFDALIDAYVAGSVTYEQFHKRYWDLYIGQSGELKALSQAERDHYAAVNEKQEWTADTLSEEERKYGWIDTEELRAWLKVHEMVKPPRTA